MGLFENNLNGNLGFFKIMGLWDLNFFKNNLNGFWDFYHGTNKGPRGVLCVCTKS